MNGSSPLVDTGNLVETYENTKGGQSKVTLTARPQGGPAPVGDHHHQGPGGQLRHSCGTGRSRSWKPQPRPPGPRPSPTRTGRRRCGRRPTSTPTRRRTPAPCSTTRSGCGSGTRCRTLGTTVLAPVFDWIEDHAILDNAESEKVWVDPRSQYAGTIDLLAPARDGNGWLLVDFKSQERDRLEVWDNYPLQLAGYADCCGHDWSEGWPGDRGPLRRITLLLHRTEPRIKVHEWERGTRTGTPGSGAGSWRTGGTATGTGRGREPDHLRRRHRRPAPARRRQRAGRRDVASLLVPPGLRRARPDRPGADGREYVARIVEVFERCAASCDRTAPCG